MEELLPRKNWRSHPVLKEINRNIKAVLDYEPRTESLAVPKEWIDELDEILPPDQRFITNDGYYVFKGIILMEEDEYYGEPTIFYREKKE